MMLFVFRFLQILSSMIQLCTFAVCLRFVAPLDASSMACDKHGACDNFNHVLEKDHRGSSASHCSRHSFMIAHVSRDECVKLVILS